MSAKQVSLKSPVTIGVVTVLLVGVVFLNVNTFGGSDRKNTSRGYRVQAHPPVPMDAGQLVVCETGLRGSGVVSSSAFTTAGLERDPFFPKQAQPKAVMNAASSRTRKPTSTRTVAKPLECSAIMLGGIQPMAIINGEGRHPGDKIRGMILIAVDADGVTLRKSNGTTVNLPVGVQRNEDQSFRVITRTKNRDDQGRTRLVDQ